jgi:predicted ATP-grasp superfamily ATP-dependent carboligase
MRLDKMHDAILLKAELEPLRRPIVVAAFWGFGDGTGSAVATLRHIRTLHNAPEVATVDPDRFYDFTVARPRTVIEDGERVLRWPGTRFYVIHAEERDVVLLSGREPHIAWRAYCEAVADFMREVGATEFLALGSFGAATPHTRPAPIWMIQSDGHFEELLGLTAQRSRYEGPTDIASTVIAHLRSVGYHTARLSALVPYYIRVGPNPSAEIALLRALEGPLGLKVPTESLERAAEEFNAHADGVVADLDDAPQMREHIQEMERVYDAGELGTPKASEASEPGLPDAEKLVQGIEEFLRDQSDAPDSLN